MRQQEVEKAERHRIRVAELARKKEEEELLRAEQFEQEQEKQRQIGKACAPPPISSILFSVSYSMHNICRGGEEDSTSEETR